MPEPLDLDEITRTYSDPLVVESAAGRHSDTVLALVAECRAARSAARVSAAGDAFYRLTAKQRDAAWRECGVLEERIAALEDATAEEILDLVPERGAAWMVERDFCEALTTQDTRVIQPVIEAYLRSRSERPLPDATDGECDLAQMRELSAKVGMGDMAEDELEGIEHRIDRLIAEVSWWRHFRTRFDPGPVPFPAFGSAVGVKAFRLADGSEV